MEDLLMNLPASVLVGLIMVLSGFTIYMVKKEFRKFNRKLDLMHIDQKSMDYALERNFKNGYSKDRDEMRKKLLKDKEYING